MSFTYWKLAWNLDFDPIHYPSEEKAQEHAAIVRSLGHDPVVWLVTTDECPRCGWAPPDCDCFDP